MTLLDSIFVVEGKNDYEKVIKCGVTYAVITKGYNVSRETIKHLQVLEKSHTIVILTDPDGPGKKIGERISAFLVNPLVLNVAKSIAIGKKEVGIERIPLNTLKEIIKPYTEKEFISHSNVTYLDLLNLGLGGANSREKKDHVSAAFSLLPGPLKNMHKQILLLNIQLEDIKESLDEKRRN